MIDFGCSGGKHSKYCPIWLKIEIYTPYYIHYPQNQICAAAAHRRHGGGFVKKHGFFNNFPIYAQLKNLLKRRFDAVMAALTASNTHHDLKQESSIFINIYLRIKTVQFCIY